MRAEPMGAPGPGLQLPPDSNHSCSPRTQNGTRKLPSWERHEAKTGLSEINENSFFFSWLLLPTRECASGCHRGIG